MVLSQLAWESNSPLFDAIDAAGSVPPYKHVALPTAATTTASGGVVGRGIASPLVHRRVRELGARVPESPLSALHDRLTHSSPGSTARRALFSPGGSKPKSPIPIAPKPSPQAKGGVTIQLIPNVKVQALQGSPGKDTPLSGEGADADGGSGQRVASEVTTQTSPLKAVLANSSPCSSSSPPAATNKPLPLPLVPDIMPAATVLSPSKAPPTSATNLGSVVRPLIPTSPPIPSVTVTQTTPMRGQLVTTPSGSSVVTTSPRPKRTGSLALFYRKTYQLAFIRIKDLCERLGLAQDFIHK